MLIGTPGRLLDHVLHTNALKVNNIRCLVLDEADRLLDMGFIKDIIRLVEELDNSKLNAQYDPMALLKAGGKQVINPEETSAHQDDESLEDDHSDLNEMPLNNHNSKKRQTILLSATLSKGVSELADFTMKDHIYIDALDAKESNVISSSLIIPNTVKQEFLLTYVKHRLFTLSALIVAKTKENAKMFIFMASSQMVEYHYELFNRCLLKMPLNRGKLKVGDVAILDENTESSEEEEEEVLDTTLFKLHGSMDQKMRKEVFNNFRAVKRGILLCTVSL